MARDGKERKVVGLEDFNGEYGQGKELPGALIPCRKLRFKESTKFRGEGK